MNEDVSIATPETRLRTYSWLRRQMRGRRSVGMRTRGIGESAGSRYCAIWRRGVWVSVTAVRFCLGCLPLPWIRRRRDKRVLSSRSGRSMNTTPRLLLVHGVGEVGALILVICRGPGGCGILGEDRNATSAPAEHEAEEDEEKDSDTDGLMNTSDLARTSLSGTTHQRRLQLSLLPEYHRRC